MAQNIFGVVHTLLDNAGAIEVGGTIEVYDAGTTTPRTLYSDRALSTTAGSTITADAAGRFPERWIADGVMIKLVYKDADGATLATRDYANDNEVEPYTVRTMRSFGAVGDGTILDDDAVQLAAASGCWVIGSPDETYLISEGFTHSNGTVFFSCHWKAKTGTGGYTSTNNYTDRYTASKTMMRVIDDESGGGLVNCKFSTDGNTEVVITALAIERGLETKPFVMQGVTEFSGFSGEYAVMSVNEAGAAGLHFDTIIMRNIGTTRSNAEGYWQSFSGYVQSTGLIIDGDVASHYSKLIRGGKVICEDFYQTGQAWIEGPQVDGVTIASNGAALNPGRDVYIDEIFCRNLPGEALDAQGRGWRVGRVTAINTFTGPKVVHGGQGSIDTVHVESVGYAGIHLNPSSYATQDTKLYVGTVTGRNVGKYILNSGTLASATATTAVLAVGASSLDDYYNKPALGLCIRITGGTGSGQERQISDYVGSSRTVTVSAWGVTPDNTSTYEILLCNNRAVVSFSVDDGSGSYTGHLNGSIIENVAVEDDASYTKFHVYSGMSATAYTNVVGLSDPGAATGGDFAGTNGDLPSITIVHRNVGQTRILASSFVGVDHTGSTSETTLATITVPANAMGANGFVIIEPIWSWTENGNVKTVRVKFGGTTYGELTGDTALLESSQQYIKIGNRNATNSQVGFNGAASFAVSGSDKQTSSVDTESAVTILLTGQLADGADTVTLEGYTVTVCYKA